MFYMIQGQVNNLIAHSWVPTNGASFNISTTDTEMKLTFFDFIFFYGYTF